MAAHRGDARPGGVFASFGAQLHLADPEVEGVVHEVRSQVLDDDVVPSPDGTPSDGPMQWPGTELVARADFTDVRQSVFERRLLMSAEEYVAHLSTISAYLELSGRVRARVLTEILGVLPERVALNGDLTLHLARLRS